MKTLIYASFFSFTACLPATAAYNFVTLAGVAPGSEDGVGAGVRFNQPEGVVVDSAGNLYVADTPNHTIRKISPSGVVTTFAGSPGISGSADGTGSAARFNGPSGLAVDSAGNIYVADAYNWMIRKITPAGVVITLAGSAGGNGFADGTGAAAKFSEPKGVAVDGAGNVYVADTYNSAIRKITPAGVVTTIAGAAATTGSADGTGSAARFNLPYGVAVDSAGNIYVGDTSNHTIRKVTQAGVVTTIAGTAGSIGSTDGTGASARFNNPGHIALDSAGNIWVVDTYNQTIRKVTPTGIVTTIAGTAGSYGNTDGTGSAARFTYPYGVTVAGAGIIYIADTDSFTIRMITPAGVVTTIAGTPGIPGSADGKIPGARFLEPEGVVVDGAGNTYVADSGNNTIRKITPAGVVTTLAGTAGVQGSADGTGAAAQFLDPTGLAVDSTGNVYVADSDNHTIRKITPAGVVTTLAGSAGNYGSADGIGASAQFYYPYGLAIDGSGNLFVADAFNYTVRKITPAGVVTTFAGTAGVKGSADGNSAAAQFDETRGVAVDSAGNVYVSEASNTIRKITPVGVVTTLAGTTGAAGSLDGIGAAARFAQPTGLAVDGAGNVYVADTQNDTVRKITPVGVVTTLAGTAGVQGIADGTGAAARFHVPVDVAVDNLGNVYVADTFNDSIRKITPAAVVSTIAGFSAGPGAADTSSPVARFNAPNGAAIDSFGNLYVADTNNDTIRKVTPAGDVTTLAGSAGNEGWTDGTGATAGFFLPKGVAVDTAGNIYVADTGSDTIRKITPAGVVTTLAGLSRSNGSVDGTGAAARFRGPGSVAVDSMGNVYVADTYNYTIRKVSPAGVVTTLAGSAGNAGSADGTGAAARFYFVNGVAVDGAGNVFVADSNNTIRKITPAGVVTTLAGSAGSYGNADGTGAAARFNFPTGLVVDGAGNVYVADTGNLTIREVTPAGVVTTVAGSPGVAGNVDGSGASAQFYSPHGISVDAAGNVFVTDPVSSTVRKITPLGVVTTLAGVSTAGATNGAAAAARFNGPNGMAADSAGNVYVADAENEAIRKITPAGVVTTLAGSPGISGSVDGTGANARFNHPNSVAVDNAGVIYVADAYNCTIRKITPAGVVTTIAGSAGLYGSADGTGGAARFNSPSGVTVDNTGNVYVADSSNDTIRKITPAGVVTTFAGSAGLYGSADGTGSAAQFENPVGMAVDGTGNIYVADQDNETIRKITPGGVVTTFAGSPGNAGATDGTGTAATFYYPTGLAVDSAGNVYVTDQSFDLIRKISSAGAVTTIAGNLGYAGNADGIGVAAQFNNPSGVAVNSAGIVYVADTNNNTIRRGNPVAAITLGNLAATYDGTAKLATAATTPDSLTVILTYDGSTTAPTNAGTYAVVAAINDSTYTGSASGTLVIAKAGETITFGGPASQIFSATPIALSATASSGLPIDFSVVSGPATISASTLTLTGTGTVVVRASQAGNSNFNPAPDVDRSMAATPNHGAPASTDFNGDGKSDLLWQDTLTGDRLFWLMNGTAPIAGLDLGTLSTDWTIAAVGDFNADGQPDLVWQNTVTGERLIWLMNGLTPFNAVSLGTVSTDWLVVGTGDLNADGYSDLLWTNTVTGERAVWLMNGTTPAKAVSFGIVPFQWALAGAGDFNGDGQTDLLWDNTLTGAIAIWVMNGTTRTSTVSVGMVSPQLQIAGAGDYNGDGQPDILWTNRFTGERSVWLMTGTTHTSTVSLTTIPLNWVLFHQIPRRVWADFNADGKSDLIWQNTTTGQGLLYLMNGTTPFTAVSLGTADPNLQIAATGDFNADGKADLVWQNLATGDRFIWLMNGTTLGSSVDLGVVSTDWSIVGTGDFNADGYSDLIWKNAVTGEYLVWLMNGTTPFNAVSLGVIDPNLQLVGTGDFNSDSSTDLVWQNLVTGERLIWLMNGTAFGSSVSLGTVSTDWSLTGTGDFNADGQTDLIWVNKITGERLIWLMNGTTPFSGISLGIYPAAWSIKN